MLEVLEQDGRELAADVARSGAVTWLKLQIEAHALLFTWLARRRVYLTPPVSMSAAETTNSTLSRIERSLASSSNRGFMQAKTRVRHRLQRWVPSDLTRAAHLEHLSEAAAEERVSVH
jgi:hypothetical protein